MGEREQETVADSVDTDAVQDSLEGMLLLAAWGDALGAAREPAALAGEVLAGDADTLALPTAGEVLAARGGGDAWGVWPDTDALRDVLEERGLPTDDTAVRITLVGEWLWETMAAGGEITEAAFEAWLAPHAEPGGASGASGTSDRPWLERRRGEQASQWRVLFADARRFHADPRPGGFTPGPENRLYRPGRPVIFGPFLYLPLAAAFYRRPALEVYRRFAEFSILDQEHGRAVTGLLAALVAQAVRERPFRAGIGEWLFSAAGPLLHDARAALRGQGLGVATETCRRAWLDEVEEALVWGRDRGLEARLEGWSSAAFLRHVADQLYPPALLAGGGTSGGLAPFEPLLVLRQLAVTAAYAGDDPGRLLRLLAAGAGDADTLAFLVGTLAGAWYGRQALVALPALADELAAVERMLWRLFQYDVPLQAGMHAQLLAEAGR